MIENHFDFMTTVFDIQTPTNSDAWDTSAFGSMGDVDWSKRSYGGYFGGADAFSSMGDVDWGKRSVGPAHQFGSGNKDKRSSGLYRNWLSRQNSPGIAQSRYHLLSISLSFDVSTLILIKILPQLNCRFQNQL